jgi:hypothetical protein
MAVSKPAVKEAETKKSPATPATKNSKTGSTKKNNSRKVETPSGAKKTLPAASSPVKEVVSSVSTSAVALSVVRTLDMGTDVAAVAGGTTAPVDNIGSTARVVAKTSTQRSFLQKFTGWAGGGKVGRSEDHMNNRKDAEGHPNAGGPQQ